MNAIATPPPAAGCPRPAPPTRWNCAASAGCSARSRRCSDITLTVRPGERRAVLGSNGAGKTTLFNCITGDFPPTSGVIRFFGEDVTKFPPHERIRRGLRRTYQISLLFGGLTVLDNVYLACRGVSRGRFSLIRPRADDALMQSAATWSTPCT